MASLVPIKPWLQTCLSWHKYRIARFWVASEENASRTDRQDLQILRRLSDDSLRGNLAPVSFVFHHGAHDDGRSTRGRKASSNKEVSPQSVCTHQ